MSPSGIVSDARRPVGRSHFGVVADGILDHRLELEVAQGAFEVSCKTTAMTLRRIWGEFIYFGVAWPLAVKESR